MKGLIIREPWMSKIVTGQKTWELRSRPTEYRGSVALIRKGAGLIVAIVDLIDCLPPVTSASFDETRQYHAIPKERDSEVLSAGWVHPWVLSNLRVLEKPIAAGQKPGAVIWVTLGPAVISELERQYGDQASTTTKAAA